MTKKPNFAKFLLGTCVLALLFIGAWATTRAPLTSAKTSATKSSVVANNPNAVSRYAAPLAPASGDDSIFAVFELEGDITDTAPNGVPDDWSSVNCGGGNAVANTGVLFDGLDNTIYTGGGSKDHELISSWLHKDGSVPPKDEILNAYAAKYTGSPNGDDILIFGADRWAINGTAFIGIWFFQQPVFAAADGRFRQGELATDALAAHEIGDVLVLVEFTGGGSVPTAKVFEWVGTGGSEAGGTLNNITGTQTNENAVLSISNALPQAISSCPAWVHAPKSGPNQTIQVNAFFEGGINLDAFPALAGSCFSSFLVETRSSAVVTATLKDFTLGQFNTCVEIGLTKTADDTVICEGTPTEYTYKVSNSTQNNVDITLVDDNATPLDPTDDFDVLADCAQYNQNGNGTLSTESVGPGNTEFTCTRTLAEGEHTNSATVVASFGGNTDDATATETVLVSTPPTADAGNGQSVCLNSGFGTHDFVLSGSVTDGTPSWSIVGANTAGCSIFSGPSTLTPTVRCNAFGTATARLTATSDAPAGTECPSATSDVLLTIKPNATAAAGDNQAVCVDDTFTSTNFELSGSVTNATPSWAITGGNSANCSIVSGEETTLTPTVTCTAIGTATLRLTAVSNNGCTNAVDDLVLTVNSNPEANAGDDQIACAAGVTTPFTLAGSADNGTSLWTCESGAAICANVQITTPTSPTSGVVFTGTGSVTLKLTTTAESASCGTAEDTVVLTVDPNPVVTICGDEACSSNENLVLTANVTPGSGTITYSWTGPGGGISGAADGPSITVVLPGTYTVQVTRKATTDSPACPDSESMHVGLCPGGVCSP